MHSLFWLTVSLAPLAIAQRISKSARCGPDFGLTCKGSNYGDCCSQYSYCGSTDDYCADGCQSGFGTCKGSVLSSTKKSSSSTTTMKVASSSSIKTSPTASIKTASTSPVQKSSSSTRAFSAVTPSSTLKVTTNARCGSAYDASPKDQTCAGSSYGDCCSQYGYCGSTDAYCSKGCQSGFGNCKPVTSSIKTSSATSRTSTAKSSSVSSTKISTSSGVSASSTNIKSSTGSSVLTSRASTSSSAVFSSSAIPSTQSLAVSSSSSVATRSSDLVSSSASTTISTLPTASSSTPPLAACSPSTNYLSNARFTSGLIPWTELGNVQASSTVPQGGQDYGPYYKFTTKPNQVSGSRLVQTVKIPSGTVVKCSAWAIIQVEDETVKDFTMLIDGKPCAAKSFGNEGQWYNLAGPNVVLSGDEHEVELVMTNPSQSYILEFGWDDAVVEYVSCEGVIASSTGPSSVSATISPTILATTLTTQSSTISSATSLSLPFSPSISPSSSPSAAGSDPTASPLPSPPTSLSSTLASTSSQLSTASPSSSLISSTTVLAASPSPPSCNTITNAVVNGDAPGLTPWTSVTFGTTTDNGGIFGNCHSPSLCYSWTGPTSSAPGFHGVRLIQSSVQIPSGTQVKCSAWGRVTRNSDVGSSQFLMLVDGQTCIVARNSGSFEWRELSGDAITVSGDTHTVEMVVAAEGLFGDSPVMLVDDIVVIPVLATCNTPPVSSSLASSPSPVFSTGSQLSASILSTSSLASIPAATPTPSPSPISASSTLSTMAVSASSSILSSLSSPSASASCVQAPSPVPDGQFTNRPSSWTAVIGGFATGQGVVAGAGHGDSSFFSFSVPGFEPNMEESIPNTSALFLSQRNLRIPSGTSLQCSAWGKVSRSLENSGQSTRWEIYLDDQLCASSSAIGESDWAQVRPTVSQMIVSGDSHTLGIFAFTDSGVGDGATVGVDDVELLYLLGPNKQPICLQEMEI